MERRRPNSPRLVSGVSSIRPDPAGAQGDGEGEGGTEEGMGGDGGERRGVKGIGGG